MQQKLTRSQYDRKLLGVCGGLAAFFGIDATWIRLVWAFGTLCSVGGLLCGGDYHTGGDRPLKDSYGKGSDFSWRAFLKQ